VLQRGPRESRPPHARESEAKVENVKGVPGGGGVVPGAGRTPRFHHVARRNPPKKNSTPRHTGIARVCLWHGFLALMG
jgi:hypothetical protein